MGSNKVFSMFLHKYTFIKGWIDIKIHKKIDSNTYTRVKYDNLKLDDIKGFVLKGDIRTYQINKKYKSLIVYSLNFCYKHIKECIYGLKFIFSKITS